MATAKHLKNLNITGKSGGADLGDVAASASIPLHTGIALGKHRPNINTWSAR
jgi:hypothetical protein